MLAKKHFKGIAFVLSTSVTREEIINGLCGYFKNDNPKFDMSKFLKECKLK